MKHLTVPILALASLTTSAQTTTLNQAPHVHTALNHFTVIDPGEPITMFALADHGSFELQRYGDKLFLEPIRENSATNLFVWTATRQLIYELDPVGDVSKMDLLVRTTPPPGRNPTQQVASRSTDDEETQRLSSRLLSDAFIHSEKIIVDVQKQRPGIPTVRIEEVLRSQDRLLIRFSIHNQSPQPFRVTSPDVFQPRPTQTPISIPGLRNHQLTEETAASFKAIKGSPIGVIHAEVLDSDLAPGQSTTGVITVSGSEHNPPQLYQLDFGSFQNYAVTVEAVL